MYAAEVFADWACELTADSIPADVRRRIKLDLLDCLGTGLAALAILQDPAAHATAVQLGGPPEATALGVPERISAPAAAFCNGATMHALGYDSTHETALVHSGAVILPVVLALGETTSASGADALTAAVAGYEATARIALAGEGRFHARGFHPTSVCGVFGAALAASRLRQLTRTQVTGALGIAGSQSAGLLEFLSDGSEMKPLHVGWAALSGLIAASLAANGATGPASVLEGDSGLLNTHLDRFSTAPLTTALGSHWEAAHLAFKPYPVCHFAHTCLEALADIIFAQDLSSDDVSGLHCRISDSAAVGIVLEPQAEKLKPRGPSDARFSLPYCLASLLVRGHLGLDSFTISAIHDDVVLRVAECVSYEVDTFPGGGRLSGGIRVTTRDGRIFEKIVLHPRGGTQNPMTDDGLVAKFRSNVALGFRDSVADDLLDVVSDFENTSVAALMRAVATGIMGTTAAHERRGRGSARS